MTNKYSRQTIEWVLENLLEFRAGRWPDTESLEYLPSVRKGYKKMSAYYTNACNLAADIDLKLDSCNYVGGDGYLRLDGLMVKLVKAYGESYESVADWFHLSPQRVRKGVETTIRYISNDWPKHRGYKEYYHKKRQDYYEK